MSAPSAPAWDVWLTHPDYPDRRLADAIPEGRGWIADRNSLPPAARPAGMSPQRLTPPTTVMLWGAWKIEWRPAAD